MRQTEVHIKRRNGVVAKAKQVGEQRYRESYGRYLEDFVVGDVYEHRPGRSITESDNTWFTLLTMNQHPLHFDKAYSEKTEFGQVLVNSCLTISIVTGMSVSDISQKTIANLGWDKVRLTGPVFIGDTIYAESKVLSKRMSASRPHQGIVSVATIGKNQHGNQVISFERSMLIPEIGHAVDDQIEYWPATLVARYLGSVRTFYTGRYCAGDSTVPKYAERLLRSGASGGARQPNAWWSGSGMLAQ